MLKQKEIKRATLIEACIKGQCTIKQVAVALGLSERRVKQIKKEVTFSATADSGNNFDFSVMHTFD